MSSIKLPILNIIKTQKIPILKQLHLEETLLRTCTKNYFLWNTEMPETAIVLGISGKPLELIHTQEAQR